MQYTTAKYTEYHFYLCLLPLWIVHQTDDLTTKHIHTHRIAIGHTINHRNIEIEENHAVRCNKAVYRLSFHLIRQIGVFDFSYPTTPALHIYLYITYINGCHSPLRFLTFSPSHSLPTLLSFYLSFFNALSLSLLHSARALSWVRSLSLSIYSYTHYIRLSLVHYFTQTQQSMGIPLPIYYFVE